jgi:hypothetical protein
MNGKNRIARGVGLLSAIVMLVSAYSCAAPDALPGPDVDADAGPARRGQLAPKQTLLLMLRTNRPQEIPFGAWDSARW